MPRILVEEDRVLRLVQVMLDPMAPAERVAAFADYNATDVPDFHAWLEAFRREVPRLYPAEVRLVQSQEELREQIAQAGVAIVEGLDIGEKELQLATRLKLVQKFGTITDNIDLRACQARGMPVRTLRRRTNMSLAEHTMMLMLALARRLPLINGLVTPQRLASAGFPQRPYDSRHTASANFGRIPGFQTLAGMRLGLLGFGEIGQEVALRARAFGMDVVYHKRSPLQPEDEQQRQVRQVSFEELFASSDFVSIHVPMSAQTRGLVGASALAKMKPGSFLVNTARAEIVDHDALVQALRSGHLGGAGFDVLYGEPTSEDEPLLSMPNVILTPHMAGASRVNGLEDARQMLMEIDACLVSRDALLPIDADRGRTPR